MQRQLLVAHPTPVIASSMNAIDTFGSCAASARCVTMPSPGSSHFNKLKKDIVRERDLCRLMYDLYKKSPVASYPYSSSSASLTTANSMSKPNNNNRLNNQFNKNNNNGNNNKKRRSTGEPLYNRPKTVTPTRQQSQVGGLTTPKSRSPNSVQSSPYYAGAKFSEAPQPSDLPMPPTHWINSSSSTLTAAVCKTDIQMDLSVQLNAANQQ